MRLLCVVIGFLLAATPASARDLRVHVEADPLPFILGGYGLQVGLAHKAIPGWRLGLGNFSLDVPDIAAQLNSDNEGFHLRVRRSHALYGLHFFSGLRGWCVGGSMRYLRLEYTHDDSPGEHVRVGEFSVEAIGGYKWHPADNGFYLMPWVAIAKPIIATGDAELGTNAYQTDFVQLFMTANIGYQF